MILEEAISTIGFKISLDFVIWDDEIQSSSLKFLLSFFSLLEHLITGGFLGGDFFLGGGGSKKLSSSLESKNISLSLITSLTESKNTSSSWRKSEYSDESKSSIVNS